MSHKPLQWVPLILISLVAVACADPVTAPDRASQATVASLSGGTNLPDCALDLTGVSVSSGGNRGGHTLISNSMHVFVSYNWRPCTPGGERIDIEIKDGVTGAPQQVSLPTFMGQYGGQYKGTSYSSNGKLSYPYNVRVYTTNPLTGAIVADVSLSIVTDKKI